MGRAAGYGGAGASAALAPAIIAVLLLAGCAGSAPRTEPMAQAVAPGVAPSAMPAPVVAAPPGARVSDDQRVRCIDAVVTGSRVPQRVCRTEFRWKLLEEQSKERGREMQGPIYGSGVAGSPPI